MNNIDKKNNVSRNWCVDSKKEKKMRWSCEDKICIVCIYIRCESRRKIRDKWIMTSKINKDDRASIEWSIWFELYMDGLVEV